ncbi:VanW family protein [Clostridiaceae bacterium M8S5]|nr:VanW family protein [Clostridiaceae bacterium M8S5]
MHSYKPKNRSSFRIFLGKNYYTYKRYIKWLLSHKKFARVKSKDLLSYTHYTHKTPLYRKLKDVDMWVQENKVINLKIATKKLSGIIVYPGQTLSYWRIIGKPTKKKGYVDGMFLKYGKYTTGTGGGLCQLSNLIYFMTLHTPLKVVERYRHSYDVFPDTKRTQPFGSGATCVYNYRDLQIYNDTPVAFQLKLEVTDKYLEGSWHSTHEPTKRYEVYEKEHKITHEVWGGYVRHNLINRRVYNLQGSVVGDEYVAENHALMMYEPLLTCKQCEE